jgi:hypothetical protein
MVFLSSVFTVICSAVRRQYAGATSGVRRRSRANRETAGAWALERLEVRALLATITVLNTHNAGPGSLRAAIGKADLRSAQDTIKFAPSVKGTISLSSALPDLSTNLIIAGPGSSVLTIARGGVDGTPAFRVFTVPSDSKVAISGLTVSGGVLDAGDNSDGSGGGIENSGTLSITNVTISGNSVSGGGDGGGISNSGTMVLTDCTLSGNSATALTFSISVSGGEGGGVSNSGTMAITDSTLSGNSAAFGGGIANSRMLTLSGSTLSGNTAGLVGQGGGIFNSGTLALTNSTLNDNLATAAFRLNVASGGGIFNSGVLAITYCTLSGNSATDGGGVFDTGVANMPAAQVTSTTGLFANTTGGNVFVQDGADFVSLGHNLFSDSPGVGLDPSDLINTDPLLGPLAENGGPTATMALLSGSPAINAAVPIPGVNIDQRGYPRSGGTFTDIGAFEVQSTTTVISVQRLGVHLEPTSLVLTFNGLLNADRADDRSNYRLIWLGPDGRPGTKDDRVVPIRFAQYDAASQTVTLRPIRQLPLNRTYELTVVGTSPAGLTDANGAYLDGAGTGQPGSDFVTIVTAKSLA